MRIVLIFADDTILLTLGVSGLVIIKSERGVKKGVKKVNPLHTAV